MSIIRAEMVFKARSLWDHLRSGKEENLVLGCHQAETASVAIWSTRIDLPFIHITHICQPRHTLLVWASPGLTCGSHFLDFLQNPLPSCKSSFLRPVAFLTIFLTVVLRTYWSFWLDWGVFQGSSPVIMGDTHPFHVESIFSFLHFPSPAY